MMDLLDNNYIKVSALIIAILFIVWRIGPFLLSPITSLLNYYRGYRKAKKLRKRIINSEYIGLGRDSSTAEKEEIFNAEMQSIMKFHERSVNDRITKFENRLYELRGKIVELKEKNKKLLIQKVKVHLMSSERLKKYMIV
jgi:hypothetical protein